MPAHFLPVSRLINPIWNAAMHWNDPPEYFFYPYLLVSPFVTGMGRRRADFGASADKLTIYADSGGYQVVTQKKQVSALDVLAWEEKIADVGFTLDRPPFSYECNEPNYKLYPKEYFDKCLDVSVKNANTMLEARDNKNMKLYAVVQGKDRKEVMTWHKAQTKDHEFDGYVIAITAAVNVLKDTYCWLGQLDAAKEIGTDVHFLGRSEPLLAILLAKLSRVTGKMYTYDTSSAVVGPRFGKYYDPYYHNLIWLSKDESKRPNISEPPCDCPVCQKHTLEEIASIQHLITLHNVYCIKRFNEYVNAISKDDEMFEFAVGRILSATRMYQGKKEEIQNQINSIMYEDSLNVQGLGKWF